MPVNRQTNILIDERFRQIKFRDNWSLQSGKFCARIARMSSLDKFELRHWVGRLQGGWQWSFATGWCVGTVLPHEFCWHYEVPEVDRAIPVYAQGGCWAPAMLWCDGGGGGGGDGARNDTYTSVPRLAIYMREQEGRQDWGCQSSKEKRIEHEPERRRNTKHRITF